MTHKNAIDMERFRNAARHVPKRLKLFALGEVALVGLLGVHPLLQRHSSQEPSAGVVQPVPFPVLPDIKPLFSVKAVEAAPLVPSEEKNKEHHAHAHRHAPGRSR